MVASALRGCKRMHDLFSAAHCSLRRRRARRTKQFVSDRHDGGDVFSTRASGAAGPAHSALSPPFFCVPLQGNPFAACVGSPQMPVMDISAGAIVEGHLEGLFGLWLMGL